LTDLRVENFARILVDYSTKVQPGDRVGVTTSTLGEPLVQALYKLILERGAYPHVWFTFADEHELFYTLAGDHQLDYISPMGSLFFEEFEVLIKAPAAHNTRALSRVDPRRQARAQKANARFLEAQMRRGAEGTLRWMSTLFPTQATAMEAEMGFQEYQDFFYRACHADLGTPDPVAYWQNVQAQQQRYADYFVGRDQLQLRGPHVDLRLSVKGRTFLNSCGLHNLPDGEVYTGPVETSLNGWVHYTYPAVIHGRVVEGIELTFEAGRVVMATAQKNQDFLLKMLDIDSGARYVGEFAIGMNYEIDRFSRSILLDEKIGGSFHTALGAGYPETGSLNKSQIHWDMICDLREQAEMLLDGELVYKDGKFII
jgi:aminopeptidase